MSKLDVSRFITESLENAKCSNGIVDIDEIVDSGINDYHIYSEMTGAEKEVYYWKRNAETLANVYGFYSVYKGIYVNYEIASIDELDKMIENLDKNMDGYEKRKMLLYNEKKKRDKEHCAGQMEFTTSGEYRERKTLDQMIKEKKNKEAN